MACCQRSHDVPASSAVSSSERSRFDLREHHVQLGLTQPGPQADVGDGQVVERPEEQAEGDAAVVRRRVLEGQAERELADPEQAELVPLVLELARSACRRSSAGLPAAAAAPAPRPASREQGKSGTSRRSTVSGQARSKANAHSDSIGAGPTSGGTSRRHWCTATPSRRWVIADSFSMFDSRTRDRPTSTRAWLTSTSCACFSRSLRSK